MKYLSLLMSLFLTYSCYANDDVTADVLKVTIPSNKIISASIADCSSPELVVTSKKGTMSFDIDSAVDCDNVRRALFLAGARDDINDSTFRINLVFDKASFTLIQTEYHQNKQLLFNDQVEELLAEHTMR